MATVGFRQLVQPSKPALALEQLTFELLDAQTPFTVSQDEPVAVSACQSEIIKADIPQWVNATIYAQRKQDIDAQQVQSIWNQLCSHYTCLQSAITYDAASGTHINTLQAAPSLVRKNNTQPTTFPPSAPPSAPPSPPLPSSPVISKGVTTTSSSSTGIFRPYLRVQANPGDDVSYVVLHAPRALLDTASLSLVARGFAALASGHKLPHHVPFGIYLSFVTTKDTSLSQQFWSTTLAGLPPLSLAPTVPSTQERSSVYVDLDVDTCEKLRRCPVDRKTLFETAWALTLQQHTGTQDVAFGVVGRDVSFAGADTCVGLLDHVYPLRAKFDADATFGDAASAVRQFHREASPHAHIGYSTIQNTLPNSTLESVLAFSPDIKHMLPGGIENTFSLSIFVTGTASVRVTACFDHASASGGTGRVEMLLLHLVQAVADAATKINLPGTKCSAIDLGSAAERGVILSHAREGRKDVPQATILQLLAQSIATNANKTAIEFGTHKKATYAELNALAGRVARDCLQHLSTTAEAPSSGRAETVGLGVGAGVGPGAAGSLPEIVPICIGRSVELIAAMLAVLQSGAAYALLDPEAPSARNQAIIEACGAKGVLVQSRMVGRFAGVANWNVDDALEDTPTPEQGPAFKAAVDVTPASLAYVVFTSGSTGKPKGVMVSHGAAAAGMQCHGVAGLDRWLLFYNPIFSAAQRTMLSTLVHGATLLIARKDKLTQDLPGVLRAMRVDALGITPSALAALPDSSLEGVKRVVMVGEAVSSRVVDRWASKVALFNTYGLSECAQLNFSRRLHPGDNARIVGAPADTTAAYVLRPGSEASLAPIGIAGELCLASDQLADGYLGQPEATQRAFQKNPFGKGRLFRTGDAARLLPNGDIEVTGRLDFQAKIAGQKVDPAEIDQVLRQHPSVARSATAAVALHEPASSDASLVAAVVLQTGLETSVRKTLASLREHVAARLPSYMVPAYWMPLDVIPSSANGKVDVRAVQKLARDVGTQALLKNVLADGDVEDCEDGALVDALEVAVAECWAAVLDLPLSIIKRQYDFVSLGGSSIHAIRVISMLQDRGYAAAMADLLTPGTSLVNVASLLAPLDAAADEEAPPFSLIDTSSRRLIDNLEDAEDAYPATPLQESLLASLVAEDQDTARMYIYHRVWKVAHLDIPRLRRAMEAAFAKSEILRTSFTPTASGYVQVVHSNWQLPWTETDADLETATASAKQSLAQDAASSSKPLIRVVLVGRRHLVVVTHHALFDFWSHRFFYHDVAAAYDGDDILARPKFSRFVKHLSQLQQNGSAQQTAVFWREYLRGTEYPTLSSSVIPSSDGSATITKREMFGLSARIAQAGFTPGPVLYSAWALLLWHRTRNVDAVFATALGGRDAPVRGIDRIDGPTLTTAPQRIVVQPEETLQDLVRRVSEQLYQVMKYSQSGMREATKAAGLDASVVDTLVNVLVRGDEPEQVWSVFRPSGPRSVWESDRITMEIDVDGSSGSGSSEIRLIGKIDARQAQFLLDAYADLVELIISSPSSAVSSLDIMTPAERCVVATELTNADSSVYPNPSLVHSAFVDIAKSCSGQSHLVAVDWRGESQQTYAQLNARANAVAHRLIQLGASVGDRIPLIMDKSEEMMSVILGVIKAGAAYVPLSPDNNAERNDFIVSDVRAKLVLAHRAYTDRVTASQVSVVAVEDIIAALPPTDENPHLPDLTPNHHAYVIYTSGSTGLPKGVQVPHRTAAAAVSSMVKAESRHIGEWRTLQFANYVFDASAQDFFNTLSTGGALCIAPTDEMQSNLAGLIKVMNVKQAILTPTVAKILHPEEVPSMKTLILGGEPMTKDVVDKWLPHCDILNVYGPTETSMVVTTKKVEKGGKTAAIGKPFDTVQAYLVDPDGEHLVPYGSVGELCVAGPQVTDGYVGREDLTAAAFTNNKALGISKLYRTGDLARWLPNGDIECLGRKDNQVKIHGLRIELAEVEHAVIKTGMVRDGNVVVMPFGSGVELALVAFCVFADNNNNNNNNNNSSSSTAEEMQLPHIQEAAPFASHVTSLIDQLRSLPHYMLPKYVFPANSFPKLPSLKTDRKTLKRWLAELDKAVLPSYSVAGAQRGSEAEAVYAAVETEDEMALEGMWKAILQMPDDAQVGRAANFGALGGDSIAAIRLVVLARAQGYSLSVAKLLKCATLQEMTLTMTKMASESAHGVPVKEYQASSAVLSAVADAGLDMEADVDYIYPCPPGQAEFLSQGSRPEQVWDLMAVRPMAHISPEDWLACTSKLTAENDILRTCWTRDDESSWVGVVLKTTQLDVTYIAVNNDDDEKTFISRFWDERFVFGSPFIKYAVLRSSDPSSDPNTWDLVIKMDHAVYDGTLFRIFDDQWTEMRRGQAVPDHGSFRDFAFASYGEDKTQVLDYWRQTMEGKAPTSPTPASANISLDENQDQGEPITDSVARRTLSGVDVDRIARACGVTPAIVFQAAYQIYLTRRSSSPEQSIGFDYLLSGRNVQTSVDPQTINGTLANFLPIQCALSECATLADYLEASQDLFWAATDNGSVGLDEIYAAAGLDRQVYGNRTMFLYQPFEPIPQGTSAEEIEDSRWLPLSKASAVKLLQPYELVVEVGKALEEHRLAVYHCSRFYDKDQVGAVMDELVDILNKMAEAKDQTPMQDFLSA